MEHNTPTAKMPEKKIHLYPTRSILNYLNHILKTKCNGNLKFELYEFINDQLNTTELNSIAMYEDNSNYNFILCINHIYNSEKHCLSSISCKINNDMNLEFSSKTNPQFEGKKYNLLLRSVLILISPYIRVHINGKNNHINKIISRAINPISIYLLSKYFHAYNNEFEQFMYENNVNADTITFSMVEDFYNLRDDDKEIDENMNERELEMFLKKNPDFGNPVIMEMDISNQELINQSQKIFSDTINKLGCPTFTSKGGKLKKKATKKHTRRKKFTRKHTKRVKISRNK